MRCTEWFEDYKVVSDFGLDPSVFPRLKILEGGTLLYGHGDGQEFGAANATGPANWTAVAIPPHRSVKADRQHLRLGVDGTRWCESFFVHWADDAHRRLRDADVLPTDSMYRMKILDNGMLLFQRKDDGRLLLVAAGTWVLAKGPWGDPTEPARKRP